MERIDTTATVETPERVSFRYRLAGPGQRAAALVDLAIIAVALSGVGLVLSLLFTVPVLGSLGQALMMLAVFFAQWLYGATFETAFGGRTPGKMVLELRVVRVDGAPAQFPDSWLRQPAAPPTSSRSGRDRGRGDDLRPAAAADRGLVGGTVVDRREQLGDAGVGADASRRSPTRSDSRCRPGSTCTRRNSR